MFTDIKGSFTCPYGAIIRGASVYDPFEHISYVIAWGQIPFFCQHRESN